MYGDGKSLIGIVLAGGKSQRMGIDKASIEYHGLPQIEWTYSLLNGLCEESVCIFKTPPPGFQLPFLLDDSGYGDIGPMSGLLTAFDHFPGKALLVVGCDYPLLDRETLRKLFIQRKAEYACTCFRNQSDGRPEPLLAIYETAVYPLLREFHLEGNHSLRLFIETVQAGLIDADDGNKIESFDTPEQAERLLKKRGVG